ncbi:hypothetical protein ACI782_17315 [Geodermatophilus sp. SYSU D00703]
MTSRSAATSATVVRHTGEARRELLAEPGGQAASRCGPPSPCCTA